MLLARAAPAEDFTGVRPLGMGGSFRSVVSGNDAIYMNPAGMSLFPRYSFETQYIYSPDLYADTPSQDEHVINVSVIDNQIQFFATGLAYTRVERGDEKKGNRYDLAFSVGLTENLLVGTNIKYLNFDRFDKEDALNAVTVDVGALFMTSFGLNIGVAGYNLTNTADYIEHPVSMAVGLSYSPFRTLVMAFDWFINFQRPVDVLEPLGEKDTGYRYHFGAEYLLLGQVTVRAGYLIDNARPGDKDMFWSVGVGYVTDRFAVDFGYRGSTGDSDVGVIAFGARLFM
jgi:hypothetical protein